MRHIIVLQPASYLNNKLISLKCYLIPLAVPYTSKVSRAYRPYRHINPHRVEDHRLIRD